MKFLIAADLYSIYTPGWEVFTLGFSPQTIRTFAAIAKRDYRSDWKNHLVIRI